MSENCAESFKVADRRSMMMMMMMMMIAPFRLIVRRRI
jgi:hypothetical protein